MSDSEKSNIDSICTIPEHVYEDLKELLMMEPSSSCIPGQPVRKHSLVIKQLEKRRVGIIGINTPGKNFTIKNGKWILWVRYYYCRYFIFVRILSSREP